MSIASGFQAVPACLPPLCAVLVSWLLQACKSFDAELRAAAAAAGAAAVAAARLSVDVGLQLQLEQETNKWFPASNSSREVSSERGTRLNIHNITHVTCSERRSASSDSMVTFSFVTLGR
jgi:hypothetical protein